MKKKRATGTELTYKQTLFIKEYLIDLNATQAYFRAGFSPKSADANAATLLLNSLVSKAIQDAMNKRGAKIEITADKGLREIALLGFANMGDYITCNKDGSFVIDFSNLNRDQKAAIQEATVEEFMAGSGENARPVRRTKFKLADKGVNLERLGKHLRAC